MKKIKLLLIVFVLFFLQSLHAQERGYNYRLLLTGASFAVPDNGWFELGCEKLNAKPINKAVSGEAISHTANKMGDGTFYSMEELEEIDAFVIMHVHDKDVFDQSQLKDNYQDYKLPFDRSNYAAAYDYVLKRYTSECYNLKFNKKSKYYNTPSGKPAVVILCTHWHDMRIIYNSSVRKLSQKWGLPLIEFDKNIGFSMYQKHPVTGQQYSLIFSRDKETVNGEEFGWHPLIGKNEYIQQRMATIFVDLMDRVLPAKE